MWVFCCGAKRSGSTLQYNLIAEVVEASEKGMRIPYVEAEDFNTVKTEYENYKGLKVFKTHVLTKEIGIEIEKGNSICFYTYRDIRDVIVSLKNKGWLNRIDGSVKNYLFEYEGWMTIKDRLIQRKYEDFFDKLPVEILLISEVLKIDLSPPQRDIIASKLDLAKLKKKQFKSEKNLQVIGEHKFDKTTLLHENHINNGQVNQWRQSLSKSEILEIESIAYKWLLNHHYTLYRPLILIHFNRSRRHLKRIIADYFKRFKHRLQRYFNR